MKKINFNTLKQRVGERPFEKGKTLHEKGKVAIVAQNDLTLLATVEGTMLYHLRFEIGALPQLEIRCPCMAYSADVLCKHCVALLLYCSSSSTEREARNSEKVRSRRVKTTSKPLAKSDILPKKELKKLLTKALPRKASFDYWYSQRYFEKAEPLINHFIEQAQSYPVEQFIELLVMGFDRLNYALEILDDSGGFRNGVEGALQLALIQSFHQLTWPDIEKIRWLKLQKAKRRDVFPYIPQDFLLTKAQRAIYQKNTRSL